MTERFPGLQPRLAIVTSVDYSTGVAQTRWMDDDENGPSVPIPHPFSGRGEGIYIGLRRGSLLLLVRASYGRYIPVSIIPMRGLYSPDLSDIQEMAFDDIGVPIIDEGEIILQGPTGAKFILNSSGSLELYNSFEEGLRLNSEHDEAFRCSILRLPPVAYKVSQTGYEASGIIRRDIRPNENSIDASIFDPMFDLEAEQFLEEVGRDPTKDVTHGSRQEDMAVSAFRNPPFVEKRKILYEFGTNWNVATRQEEERFLRENVLPVRVFTDRRERRSNVLSLSLLYPNELMESVDGTLVDMFGNLLDINRNILPPPASSDINLLLEDQLEKARHTIVLHREINTRKGWSYIGSGIPILTEIPDPADATDNSRDRSRWSIDVDKEGLTKINIPATSETGNVPFLVRHESSSSVNVVNGIASKEGRSEEDARKVFRNDLETGQQRQDIFLDQFGPGGITVENISSKDGQSVDLSPTNRLAGEVTSYVDGDWEILPDKVQSGTAFHSIIKTAAALLQSSMNKNSYDVVNKDAPTPDKDGDAVCNKIIQSFIPSVGQKVDRDDAGRPTNYPNAGGRSVHANLDGSLELSIGANTIDRLSWILDTAGGIVSHIGRDRYGRSAIVQMDGSLALEVGGYDFAGSASIGADGRFSDRATTLKKDVNVFRAGKVVIRVRRANTEGTGPDTDNDNLDQVIIIDENGISIQSTGQLSLKSTQDMIFQSDSQIVLDAKAIAFFKGAHQRTFTRLGARRVI